MSIKIPYTNNNLLLQKICSLVENDFCADMETLLLPNTREYTQEEAQQMANIISEVYHYAHQIHCEACRNKTH